MCGHIPCAESLLKAGADASLKNNVGEAYTVYIPYLTIYYYDHIPHLTIGGMVCMCM